MNILFKSLVLSFYRQRTGFFFVVLLLAFGIMSSREHLALAALIMGNFLALGITGLLWAAYMGMAGGYCITLLHQKNYQFVRETYLLPAHVRWRLWLEVSAGLSAPVLTYGAFILVTGLQQRAFVACTLLTAILLLLLTGTAFLLERRTRIPLDSFGAVSRKAVLALPFRRKASWPLWTLEWLFRERGISLLLTKTMTFVLLAGVLPYYTPDTYDLRFPAFLFLVLSLLHIGLCRELFYWEHTVWSWQRSLPHSLLQRYSRLLLVLALLLLPEIFLTLRYGNLSATEILQLSLFSLSLVACYYTTLLVANPPLEAISGRLFAAFVAITFIILYHTPLSLAAVSLLVTSGLLFRKYPLPE